MSDFKSTGKKRKLPEEARQDDVKTPTEIGRKSGLTLTDLPHELLLEILTHLTCFQQERLVRVCKLWMRTITNEVDQVYLDAATLYKSLINKAGLLVVYHATADSRIDCGDRVRSQLYKSVYCCSVPGRKAAYPWKYDRRAVRQLIFNGQYVAQFSTASHGLGQLADSHFPELAKVNLVHMVMDIESSDSWTYDDSRLQVDPVLVTLTDSVVPAFPDGIDFCSPRYTAQAVREAQQVLGEYRDSYLRVPDFRALAGMDAFADHYVGVAGSGLAWSYPDSQLEWLAKWAPSLNGNPRLLALLRDSWAHWNDATCSVHGKFCRHLDLTFYKELDGQTRNLIAVYLLQLKPPGMEPPPVPFQFVKFHLRKGQAPRFGLAEAH